MTKEFDYTALVDDAMRGVVREVLRHVQQHGLIEPHHFFITFRTDHPGVMMSESLRSKYPHEITIVLQHQFRELRAEQDGFKVVLSFNNVPEKLVIPYIALTGFADPSMKFGLQFHAAEDDFDLAVPRAAAPVAAEKKTAEVSAVMAGADEAVASAKVFTLDAFRKK